MWPRWDDSPWIDGGQRVDIQATEEQVLEAAALGDLPSIVLSQATYDEEGIPRWAAPIFARQQARLAELGDNLIHLRADGTGHFIHDGRPRVVVEAVKAVVTALETTSPYRAVRQSSMRPWVLASLDVYLSSSRPGPTIDARV